MRRRTRQLIDIAKELLLDTSFMKVEDCIAAWQERTKRSRARYYYYVKIALAELDDDARKRGDSSAA
ncbi:hypothetical protein [Bythopirellula goksoeyrii]|uniref:Uncharacterized protein n=1 Tax=Bythopirellula goksoeyrii TaxID=1400387 RepID=A0A5B9QE68_9BACT|nr:hypothetical protein [Bythopirellula goksoeyrii]QEG36149.1 hypothetical protein Pr1d_34580 [Bythopirellula goksoeyrii]